ncbi:hypothetical protein KIK84_02325 [Curvibacter sp. CHRR-16]|uniref:type II secretion system protein GspL n=1 Tax=Curvibacter sp. CHRR-16 TaxID=2835872 RepID=UPI001BDAF2AA|nr:hypothetical protein [Curvibacter sp. CHRR-16]
MHPTQVLILPPAPAPTAAEANSPMPWSWIALHHQSVVSQQQGEQLAPAPKLHTRCTVMVPAPALSWHLVSLPPKTLLKGAPWLKGPQPRLRNVLEGLLEDHLLEDPAQLHFALQPDAQDGHPVWIAACHKEWLSDTLAHIRAAGYTVDAVVPEIAPAATDAASKAWLCGTAQAPYWLWSDTSGVHQRPWQAHQSAPWTRGLQSPIASIQAEAAVAEQAATCLGNAPDVQSHAQRLQEQSQTDWTLAQLDFALDTNWDQRLQAQLRLWWQAPQWRPLRWSLVAVLLIQLLGLQLYAWRSEKILEQQRAAINRVLLETFPKTVVIVNAPAQMQKAVQGLQQSSGQASANDFENLLSVWGQVLQQVPQAKANYSPVALRFTSGQLEIINGRPWGPDTQTQLQQILRSMGISTEFQNAGIRLRAAKTSNASAP